MQTDDIRYYALRRDEEGHRAREAATAEARKIHGALAALYAQRLARLHRGVVANTAAFTVSTERGTLPR